MVDTFPKIQIKVRQTGQLLQQPPTQTTKLIPIQLDPIVFDTIINTAYANAIFYANTKATQAYTNAISVPVHLKLSLSSKPLANQVINIPISFAMTIPTNCTGWVGFCGNTPSSNAIITVGYIRAGTSSNVLTMTFAASNTSPQFSNQAANTLVNNDIMFIKFAAQDASFADIGFSFIFAR